ncbi:hypothetical protein CKAH01_02098 [Colletotrichum kahawae]|uniref:Uncharacterized protein n=1 Tax=Colletotrichum kahawae TaxID=34407 RepID=A0AAE0D199_COLKA|nr:hypothetical protein CKAH01_02098 [Colletotrichum kahawae]
MSVVAWNLITVHSVPRWDRPMFPLPPENSRWSVSAFPGYHEAVWCVSQSEIWREERGKYEHHILARKTPTRPSQATRDAQPPSPVLTARPRVLPELAKALAITAPR